MAIKLEVWLPQEPWQGPPLPEYLNIYWPWYKPPVTLGAELAVTLAGADPNALVAGTTYTATVTVTNKSTKVGVFVPATLTVKIGGVFGGSALALDGDGARTALYPANGSLDTIYHFTIPDDGGGKTGSISAGVYDPSDTLLKAAIPLTITAVAAEKAAGTIYGLIYDVVLGKWVSDITPGYQVPAGADIYMAFVWSNTSRISFVGHVEMKVTWPDGTSVNMPAVENQDKGADPGVNWIVSFSPFRSEEGSHTVKATLSSGGVLLDTKTFTLVAIAEIVYAADVVISV